jgi:chromosome partitioning protein
MRSIAIINQKGGVGKTTTAVNLAAALAESGARVCVLDLDPQSHASLHLGVSLRENDLSIYDVLTGDTTLAEVRRQVSPRLWIVPAHLNLAAAEMELAGEVGREVILRDKLARDLTVASERAAAGESPAVGESRGREAVAPDDGTEFDYLLIDCPPSLGVLTLNALTAVDEVFLPLQPHFLALHGLSKLLRTIEIVASRLNPTLRLTGVVLCMFESATRLATEVSHDVEEFFRRPGSTSSVWAGAKTFSTRIRRNIRLAEAPSFGQSILEYAPQSHGAEDYRHLAHEVAESACAAHAGSAG